MTATNSIPDSCPNCGFSDLNEWDTFAATVCPNCSVVLDSSGTVVSDDIDGSRETASETSEDDSSWQEDVSVTDSSEAILIEILSRSEELSEELGVTSETEIRIGEILVSAWEQNFMLGRSTESTIAAAVYLATRETTRTIPPGCIAERVSIEKTKLKQTYKSLRTEIDCQVRPATPGDFVQYITEQLGMNQAAQLTATSILDEGSHVAGNPVGRAAAAVYLSADEHGYNTTLRSIATVVHLTKETIWNHSTRLK